MASLSLVTGATGFIGSHVVDQLLQKGERVRVLVRSPEKLADVGLAGRENLEAVKGDLLEPATIPAALEGVDALYHIAGFISTAPADREKVYRLNYDITENLFEACKRRGFKDGGKKIVYLASIFALAGGEKTPATEATPYNLADLRVDYVKAKRRAELYTYKCIEDGLPVVMVYPCFCYGPGDVYVSSSRLLLGFIQRRLPAYIAGGQNVMDVRDAAHGLLLGMERGKAGEKYLVGGKDMSYEEIFAELTRLTGYPAPKIRLPQTLGYWMGLLAERMSKNAPLDAQAALMAGRWWYYDDSKARRELGYDSRPAAETFRDAVAWFCERGMAKKPPRFEA